MVRLVQLAVHDINMDPVCAGFFDSLYFFAKARKICRKDGWCNDGHGISSFLRCGLIALIFQDRDKKSIGLVKMGHKGDEAFVSHGTLR